MINRICLGTVQFGQDYGVSNTTGKTPKKEVFQILDYCANKGIQWLDTAEDYGESQLVLGEYLKSNPNSFKIQSKISNRSDSNNLNENLKKTLDQLKIDFLDSYLVHSYEKFAEENDSFIHQLFHLKSIGTCKSIGVSIYENDHGMDQRLLNFADEIQFPFNLLDNYSQRSKLISVLKENSIEIQIRSIFLQGLFFLGSSKLPRNLLFFKPYIEQLNAICFKHRITMPELALWFVFEGSFANKILIGVDSLEQIKKNIAIIEKISNNSIEISQEINNIWLQERSQLNPSNWHV